MSQCWRKARWTRNLLRIWPCRQGPIPRARWLWWLFHSIFRHELVTISLYFQAWIHAFLGLLFIIREIKIKHHRCSSNPSSEVQLRAGFLLLDSTHLPPPCSLWTCCQFPPFFKTGHVSPEREQQGKSSRGGREDCEVAEGITLAAPTSGLNKNLSCIFQWYLPLHHSSSKANLRIIVHHSSCPFSTSLTLRRRGVTAAALN